MNRLWAALKKESALPQLSSNDESFLAAPILRAVMETENGLLDYLPASFL